MPGPLDGIRVLDFSTMVSGPVAARMLADQGADVIKIESPKGDEMRKLVISATTLPPCLCPAIEVNAGSALDLKTSEDQATLKSLVKTADVIIQNFRPGAMDRMGFGEAAMRALKPDLIYVSISGFGESGPYAHQRVYDPVIQALCGATDIQADRDTGGQRCSALS